jgi:hypothetical protein
VEIGLFWQENLIRFVKHYALFACLFYIIYVSRSIQLIYYEGENEMARFVNDDFKLKHGGRKAARISQEDLANLMYQRANKFAVEEWGDDYELEDDLNLEEGVTWYEGDCYAELIRYLMEDEALMKDVSKYRISCCSEATFDGMSSEGAMNLTGMHTLSNGLTFYGYFHSVDCGPDCAFVIIYHDGKKLRAYVPTYGNAVNMDFKCVLGEEHEYDADYDKLETKYRKLGVWREDKDFFRMYIAKYGFDDQTFCCNWDAIQQDIEARIEVE